MRRSQPARPWETPDMYIYSLSGYCGMIADHIRMDAYAKALRQSVKPGAVVLEIGTGPGVFAILACQLGASRVFAVEADEIIQVARENAAVNHCADRIEFIEAVSTQVTLPVRADVIISDMRGVLPLFGRHIPSIVDARQRFLKAGGVLIPRRDTVWAAVAEVPELYATIVEPWEQNGLDQDLGPARRLAVNDIRKARVKPEELLTEPQNWTTLDYGTVENSNIYGELKWTVGRAGVGHGITTWFEMDLADGVSLSNAPGSPETIYGLQFFPWTHPVSLSRGETVCVKLEAKLTGNDYTWRWTTQVATANPESRTREHFDQSTLAGVVMSLEKLHKTASDFVPRLSEEGILDRRVLALMNGKATLEEIARKLGAEFPERFERWQDAMNQAAAISRKYSE